MLEVTPGGAVGWAIPGARDSAWLTTHMAKAPPYYYYYVLGAPLPNFAVRERQRNRERRRHRQRGSACRRPGRMVV